jgi:hypothetical protein
MSRAISDLDRFKDLQDLSLRGSVLMVTALEEIATSPGDSALSEHMRGIAVAALVELRRIAQAGGSDMGPTGMAPLTLELVSASPAEAAGIHSVNG